MHELQDVKHYLQSNQFNLNEDLIEEYYNQIPNHILRINDQDKQWNACTQSHEESTTIDAIKEIVKSQGDKTKAITTLNQVIILNRVSEAYKKVCTLFKNRGLTHKARIPFYIMILDYVNTSNVRKLIN